MGIPEGKKNYTHPSTLDVYSFSIYDHPRGDESMKTVNALALRNNLGKVLDSLTESGEPVLVSKGKTVRAVLITPEDFKRRFIDIQSEDERKKLLATIERLRAPNISGKSSLEVLRELRGYDP
jgi:PHD/YefM family antitoxin component YafN of YafNO toxin-antitoxin module